MNLDLTIRAIDGYVIEQKAAGAHPNTMMDIPLTLAQWEAIVKALRPEHALNAARWLFAREHLPAGTFGDHDVASPESWDAAVDDMRRAATFPEERTLSLHGERPRIYADHNTCRGFLILCDDSLPPGVAEFRDTLGRRLLSLTNLDEITPMNNGGQS